MIERYCTRCGEKMLTKDSKRFDSRTGKLSVYKRSYKCPNFRMLAVFIPLPRKYTHDWKVIIYGRD